MDVNSAVDTGEICTKCGCIDRYADGRCRPCQLSSNARWRARNRDKVLAGKKEYYEANKEHLLAKARDWAARNPLKRREIEAKYRGANTEKEIARCARWRANNPEKKYAAKARRRANARQAVPSWYGEFDEFVMEEANDLIRLRNESTGISWHTDHVVPLQSQLVCGLHSWTNIGVIPGVENMRKGNRCWPGMPDRCDISMLKEAA